jgi:hypothetical protein
MAKVAPGRALTVCALGISLMALSNGLKPAQMGGAHTGFVLFGERLSGTANATIAPLFGLYLAVLATSIFDMRRRALWMSRLYAGYVLLNLVLFPFRTPDPPTGIKLAGFILGYAPIALAVAGGAAYLLTQRERELT